MRAKDPEVIGSPFPTRRSELPESVRSELLEHFARYGSYASTDPKSFAGAWSFPGHALRDEQELKAHVHLDLETLVTECARGDDFIRKQFGIESASIDVLSIRQISERVFHVAVEWTWKDADGNPKSHADAVYTVGRFEEGWRNVQVIWLGIRFAGKPQTALGVPR